MLIVRPSSPNPTNLPSQPSQLTTTSTQLSYTNQILYPLTLLTIKFSILVLYLQIFAILPSLKYSIYAGLALLSLFHISTTTTYAVLCRPRHGHGLDAYLEGAASASCAHIPPLIRAQCVVNVLGDVYMILLPLPPIWRLQLARGKKLGVAAVFLTGLR